MDARPGLDEPVFDRVERTGDADLEPRLLLDLADGGLLATLAGVGRSLGKCPGPAVSLAAATADDQPGLARLVSNDDPAGGGGGRGSQAGHGADAAPGRRTAAGTPGAGPLHGHLRTRPAAAVALRDGRVDRPPAGPQTGEGRDLGAVQHRRPDARRCERAGRAQAQPSLADTCRGADESGRRAGRVLGRDAVIHGRLWYRFRPGLQGRSEQFAHLLRRLRCQRATGFRQIDLPTRRGDVEIEDPGRVGASVARWASSVPTSPRVIGPVSAARIPRALALPSVPSMSGP